MSLHPGRAGGRYPLTRHRRVKPPGEKQETCEEPWYILEVVSHWITDAPGGTATAGQVVEASQGTPVPDGSKGSVEELTRVGGSLRPGNHTPDGSTLDAKCHWHCAEHSPFMIAFVPSNPREAVPVFLFYRRRLWGLERRKVLPSYQVVEECCWNPGWSVPSQK